MAQEAADAQDPRALLAVFERLAQLMPGNLEVLLYRAKALGDCGQYADCRRALKALLAGAPRQYQADLRAAIGTLWRDLGRPEQAESHLRAAVAGVGARPEAHEAWIDALERLNRLDEAFAAVQGALRRFPGRPALLLLAARLHRRRGALDLAETLAGRCLTHVQAPPVLRLEAGYELGHALDAQGRHYEAFDAFVAAKMAPAAACGADFAHWQSHIGQLRREDGLPSAGQFKQWAKPFQEQPLRQAFLVGCPRSGTTLLERVLDAHPGVVAAPETMVWRVDVWMPLLRAFAQSGRVAQEMPAMQMLDSLAPAQLAGAFACYRHGMEQALETTLGSRLLVDKNPSYFSLIAPLARLFPGAPLLVALRDPRAVVWSCFTQSLPINPESVAFLDLRTTIEHIQVELEHWLRLRDRLAAPWREVRYENMVNDLPGEAKKTLEFLGLPWDESVLAFHQNKAPVRSPSYASASQPVSRGALEKWRPYEDFLEPYLEPIRPLMAELGYAW